MPHLNQVKLAGRVPRDNVVWATGEPKRKPLTVPASPGGGDDELTALTAATNC